MLGMTGCTGPVYDRAAVIRAADEGVPIAALKRIFRPADDMRGLLHMALNSGRLIQLPAEDWPPEQRREDRTSTVPPHELGEDDTFLLMKIARAFKTTRLEGNILMVILRRGFASRDRLHDAVEDNRGNPENPTEKKIVDVVVCKLRKKLAIHGIKLNTIHSTGYEMTDSDRQKAWALVHGSVQ